MNVILYSTDCPKCKVIKQKLVDGKVEFKENNNVSDMQSKGIVKVPVLEVDGKMMEFVEANGWVNAFSENKSCKEKEGI